MAGGVQRLGSIRTIVGGFYLNDAPITFTPSTVTLTITAPDGTTTLLTSPNVLLLHHVTHEWYYDLLFNQRGRWQVDWLCAGSFVDTNGDTRQYRDTVNAVYHCYA